MIRIVEIITRSEQGITRPFLCRGDNGLQYFVKGHGAGRRALIAEWIAGNIGKRLGLPIPERSGGGTTALVAGDAGRMDGN
jgi:HipA-like kinase